MLSTGVLATLVAQYPEARFTVACGPYAADLFRATPRLERLIVMPKQAWNLHWVSLYRQCMATPWDLIVDFRDSLVGRILPAKQRALRKRSAGQHKVVENAAILDLNPPPSPKIWIDDKTLARAAAILPKNRPVLALGPAANWAAKQWPIVRFAELAQRLATSDSVLAGAAVMVVADGREREQVAPLLHALPERQRIEMIGEDLLMVAACLQHAQLFVGNDSGLMHIASAVGTPTLGLFGPGYEQIYGPWGDHCAVVRTPESREILLQRMATKGQPQPNLMGGLSVEAVSREAINLLLTI